MKVRISNLGDALTVLETDVTQEQFEFLGGLFDRLNDNGGAYSPFISIEKVEDEIEGVDVPHFTDWD